MSHFSKPELKTIVVPKAIADNYASIGIEKIKTDGFLETILSGDDLRFYKYLNSCNNKIKTGLKINATKPPVDYTIYDLEPVYKRFITELNNGDNCNNCAKALHAMVFEGQPMDGDFINYGVVDANDDVVVLTLTNSTEGVVRTVKDFITTFYEHYGLPALSAGRNSVFLERLVQTTI